MLKAIYTVFIACCGRLFSFLAHFSLIFQIVDSNVGPGVSLAQALWHSGDTTNKV